MSTPEIPYFPNPNLLTSAQKRIVISDLGIMVNEGAISGEEYQRRVREYEEHITVVTRIKSFLTGKNPNPINQVEKERLVEMAARKLAANHEDMPPERFARIRKP